ncbi:SGNH/GDSL hydrolase family protein [uncultured Microbacterium sp.]|uniref:SGNH/GDSL hydrolase family protein n=1 Tax=uncultured Microbacterium sp. TaxID=191216 RepID=UPI0035C94AC3
MTASTPQIVVFTGDSITDSGRRDDPEGLGGGYVRLIAEKAAGSDLVIRNTGISGNRIVDLEHRWDEDVLAARPDVLTVLVGVNDTWRRYDSDDPTSAEAFEAGYDRLLGAAAAAGVERIILMEPFLVPVTDERLAWRAEDLDEKIAAVRRLADKHGAILVPLDAVLNSAADALSPAEIAADSVHPTPYGHRLIAEQWWEAAAPVLRKVAE